jgi:Transposase DDE domain
MFTSKKLSGLFAENEKGAGPTLHVVVDSTGLKVFGEGEWKVRQHGYSKRRTWRKLHLAIDAANQEIAAAVVTTNDFRDSEVLTDLLEQVDAELDQVSGDGGYDSHENYQLIVNRGAKPVIPPRKDAVISQHGNSHLSAKPRDEVIREIRQLGRRNWKNQSGYHKRSLAETAMYRLKTIFGGTLRARLFSNQGTETFLRCCALNKMTQLGMPNSYAVI